MLLFSFSTGCCIKPIPDGTIDEMKTIKNWGDACIQRVKMLKTYYKPETKEYIEGQIYYMHAKDKSNEWLNDLVLDLNLNRNPSGNNSLLKEVTDQAVKFQDYVESVCLKEKVEKRFVIKVPTFENIMKALKAIWDAWRKANEEERERIIKEIEELKWPDFNAIKQE
jgi:hypothetical protein